MRFAISVITMLALGIGVVPAKANIISGTVNFTASGFTNGSPGPITAVRLTAGAKL
jgi:hypothetical protein